MFLTPFQEGGVMNREPAVAGHFYPGSADKLIETINGMIGEAARSPALGVVSPHAGYVFSGPVAGALFANVAVPDVCVILAPNHTGADSASFSVWPDGKWLMPMGDVPVDAYLCGALIKSCSLAEADESAHLREHSAEVQVPFLQAVNPDVAIVPVIVSSYDLGELQEFGRSLAALIKEGSDDVLVLASSDMTHYESHESAGEKDKMALEKILALDEGGLLNTVAEHRISMCGVSPTIAMLACCKELGANKAELVLYQTSGDVSGDYAQVVGYAAVAVR